MDRDSINSEESVVLLPPPAVKNDQFPDMVIVERGEKYDIIEHPYVDGATAHFHHSNGAIRANGTCKQQPGTYIVPMDEDNNPGFYKDGVIRTTEEGQRRVAKRWEKTQAAMREGFENAIAEHEGIPKQMMNSELGAEVVAETLTRRALDPKESLREARETHKFVMEKGQLLPTGRGDGDKPEVAIQINIVQGLLSEDDTWEEE